MRGADQRALIEVLEVLLNDPAWYPAVEGCFEPTAIQDRRVASVAVELVNILRSGEPFQLSDLIGRFESPEYGELVTDLQARGERRGGFQAVIDGAVPCLEAFHQAREGAAVTRNGTENERLAALTALARTPRFSTFKVRKKFL